jgi:multidrug resistance efflux pump
LSQAEAKVESARAALAAADQRVKELSSRVKTAKGQVGAAHSMGDPLKAGNTDMQSGRRRFG